MIEEMHKIRGAFGTELPTVFVVLAGIGLAIVTVFLFLPELTGRRAFWLGPAESRTGIPMSLASRVSGIVFAWVGAILFVVIHPLTLLLVLPLAFLSDAVCRRRDKQKMKEDSNRPSQPIAGKPGSG